jgi:hypothetical protein
MGLTKTLIIAGAGAALAYFLDPVSGNERRQRLKDFVDERVGDLGKPIQSGNGSPPVVVDKQPANRPTATT